MKKDSTEQILKWYKEDKFTNIINTIENLPQSEWDYEIKGILARAYVNKSNCEKAIEILFSERLRGINDPLWNYRVGFAFFHNDDKEEALPFFEKCIDLGDIPNGNSQFFIKECISSIEQRKRLLDKKASITAYKLQADSVVDGDFSYVNIGLTWKNKKNIEVPTETSKTKVIWSHESVFGVVGSQVGDFIGHFGEGSILQEGIFTQRHIAEMLTKKFSGLKFTEVEWIENPFEKVLSSGKPRLKKPKWLPEKEVDVVHLFSDKYIDVRNPSEFETDFFNIYRIDGTHKKFKLTWLMCTKEIAIKLHEMKFSCLYLKKTTIWG